MTILRPLSSGCFCSTSSLPQSAVVMCVCVCVCSCGRWGAKRLRQVCVDSLNGVTFRIKRACMFNEKHFLQVRVHDVRRADSIV